MSKVYTKKELREEICNILNLLTIYRGYSTDEAADDILELVTPIELPKALPKTDVMLSLPTVEEIELWAKEQAKIEPTGAEEFGRIWGAMWMRDKIKGGGE